MADETVPGFEHDFPLVPPMSARTDILNWLEKLGIDTDAVHGIRVKAGHWWVNLNGAWLRTTDIADQMNLATTGYA